jgi:CubicO group peptidase (beta-lactamase class C family)
MSRIDITPAVAGEIDHFISDLLAVTHIPGAGIAVVSGGRQIFSHGYGCRDLDTQDGLTANTIFPIGSTTKAFNATLIGMLVDDAVLEWDRPVQNYVPGFRLRDVFASTQVTMRDLLTMRTGLPRHDWVWYENPMGRIELMKRMQYLDFSSGFRERFQYNNLTVTIAGAIAEIITGKTWNELINERILSPLSMITTTLAMPTNGEVTRSYHEDQSGDLVQSQRWAIDDVAPAGGSVYSTVGDMAKWIAFNMANGQANGVPLINADTLREIQAPQIAARTDPTCMSPNAAYAMGWFVDTYNGLRRISHSGSIFDVNSDVSLFPDSEIGVVSYVNTEPAAIARFINERVFDLVNGNRPASTLEEKLAVRRQSVGYIAAATGAMLRKSGTRASHELLDYCGAYHHLGYGTIEIKLQEGQLLVQRNRIRVPLAHWHYDVWVGTDTAEFAFGKPHPFDSASRLEFFSDIDGGVTRLQIRLEPNVPPISFTKSQESNGELKGA